MRILVTGASGLVGGAVVRALVTRQHRAVALVRPHSDRRGLIGPGIEQVEGDLADAASLRRALVGVDAVVHAAAMLKAPWRRDFFETNVAGTARLAEACARAQQPPVLVLVSSLAACGPSVDGKPLTESSPARPVSRYGEVKLACEAACRAWAGEVATTIVRPPMVFGPGDRALLPLFQWASRGLAPVAVPPKQLWSVVDVDSLAVALVEACGPAERLAAGPLGPAPVEARGIYCVAHPQAVTWPELCDRIGEAIGRPVRQVHLPRPVVWTAMLASEVAARLRDRPTALNLDKYREAFAGAWWCAADKALHQLGVDPPTLPLLLRATVDAYRHASWLPCADVS